MIQSVLIFVLGFLCAGLIALVLLPAIWNRAVGLTRRGIEAAMPTTLEELSAKADQLRARHAVEQRRTEIERDEAKRKAAEAIAKVGGENARLGQITAERDQLNAQVAGLQKTVTELTATLTESEDSLAARNDELAKLSDLYEEAKLTASTDQMKAMGQEDEIARLTRQFANSSGGAGDAELREAMLDLAADVVRLTAQQPEQAEPIAQALALPAKSRKGAPKSLAQRIKR